MVSPNLLYQVFQRKRWCQKTWKRKNINLLNWIHKTKNHQLTKQFK